MSAWWSSGRRLARKRRQAYKGRVAQRAKRSHRISRANRPVSPRLAATLAQPAVQHQIPEAVPVAGVRFDRRRCRRGHLSREGRSFHVPAAHANDRGGRNEKGRPRWAPPPNLGHVGLSEEALTSGRSELGRRFLPPRSPKRCDAHEGQAQADDFRCVQSVSGAWEGSDHGVPPRAVERKQRATEKHE
jgi:hypothetical protein